MERFNRVENPKGPRLSYDRVPLIRQDGLYFKDLARCGKLLPYEDWRLPARERAEDLAARLRPEDIAGLMVISGHQAVPDWGAASTAGEPWALTGLQREMLAREGIRFVLQSRVESVETSVRWNNELQALAEELPFGIPVSIASDPRHGASPAKAEFRHAGAIAKLADATLGVYLIHPLLIHVLERVGLAVTPAAPVLGLLGFFLLLAVLCFTLVLIARKIPLLRRIL